MPHSTRRSFIKKSSAVGAFTILPSCVALGDQANTKTRAPSERVNLALVGSGGKGNRNRLAMLDTGLCNIVALCDVDLKGKHTQDAQKAHPTAPTFTDFRKMMDQMGSQIDAVMVSTPDHAHFAAGMLAMSMGKHVWVEKPLAHTFGQVERMIDLAARSGVVTQMGNQGHSGGNYFQFKAWTEAGVIKDVTKITAYMNKYRRWHGWGESVAEYPIEQLPDGMDWDTWINPSPAHPYSKRLHPGNWRSWFDYGSGAFGDWGPHILDTCHRFLKLGLPEKIIAVKRDGANEFVFPQASTISFAFPARENMPACDVTWYDGVDNIPELEPEFGDIIRDKAAAKKPGKIIYAKDIVLQGDSHGDVLQVLPNEKHAEVIESFPEYSKSNSNHWENFLLSCKGEEETRSPFRVSGPLTQVFNLGVIAQRLGGEIAFDRTTNKITNNDFACTLLDPEPRKGWEEFYTL
ncbi:Inositol 2-dehydrogenase [Planctomycetes bacterium CA13]|uniref:Inositol 2-dehydrogenase n=1 Tax=Novipirellula herctigrandis TaxID=2527986 RepID=A0A5C5Z075_9BACT|nr:Inositol 2-dehydrogenase [Planctomycetes bacterium CA13]